MQSVLCQQDVALEVVVVDDGSPDDVRSACEGLGEKVKYIRQENRGLSAARNTGIQASQGRFLHFLDADDWVKPDFYRTLVTELETHPDWAAVACSLILFLEKTAREGRVIVPPKTSCPFEALSRASLYTPGSVLIRRAVLEQVGLFDVQFRSCQDWDLWLRVARTGAIFGRVDAPKFYYRIHAASMSRNAIVMLDEAEELMQLVDGFAAQANLVPEANSAAA